MNVKSKNLNKVKLVCITFTYDNENPTTSVTMLEKDFLEVSDRILVKVGIIILNGIKVDLTQLKSINIEYLKDTVVY